MSNRLLNRGLIIQAGLVGLAMLMAGCAEYAAPGRGADLSVIGADRATQEANTDSGIQGELDKKPLARFPTGIAVVRIEAPGYNSSTNAGWGEGKYCVVTTRDIEDPKTVAELEKLPMVTGIAPINRMLLPSNLQSDYELRHAAASLHADLLLVYTIDTVFYTRDLASPLSVVTLGLAPDQKVHVSSTASAALLDTRNGYVYGVCEATDQNTGITIAWQTDQAVDYSRQKAESAAFKKMCGEVQGMWAKVLVNQGVSTTTPGH